MLTCFIEFLRRIFTLTGATSKIYSGNTRTKMGIHILLFITYQISYVLSSNLFPSVNECGLFITTENIIGGVETDLGGHPWTALLVYKPDEEAKAGTCGGTLINSRYVLTAAHCITPDLSKVVLGEHRIGTEIDCDKFTCAPKPVKINIEEKIVHDGYNPAARNLPNDIGLLRLSQEVQFTEFIRPICLPISPALQNKKYRGNEFFVVGWGITERGVESNVKLQAQVPIVDESTCSSLYASLKEHLTDKQFCAGDGSNGSCVGDSGGPLMTVYKNKGESNWYLVGVISFGRRDCGKRKSWPGVYTKVTKYVEWITKTVRP